MLCKRVACTQVIFKVHLFIWNLWNCYFREIQHFTLYFFKKFQSANEKKKCNELFVNRFHFEVILYCSRPKQSNIIKHTRTRKEMYPLWMCVARRRHQPLTFQAVALVGFSEKCYETLHLRYYDTGESWGRIHLRNVEQCTCVAGETKCERVRYSSKIQLFCFNCVLVFVGMMRVKRN